MVLVSPHPVPSRGSSPRGASPLAALLALTLLAAGGQEDAPAPAPTPTSNSSAAAAPPAEPTAEPPAEPTTEPPAEPAPSADAPPLPPPAPLLPPAPPAGAAPPWPPPPSGPPPPPPWQPAPDEGGMRDPSLFTTGLVLFGLGQALMAPSLVRTDLARHGDDVDPTLNTAEHVLGLAGYSLYVTGTPLAIGGALPVLSPDQERRSAAALGAGVVLTTAGAAALPAGIFFSSTAAGGANPEGNWPAGIACLVGAALGLASGVPLTVWGAAPVPKAEAPGPYALDALDAPAGLTLPF